MLLCRFVRSHNISKLMMQSARPETHCFQKDMTFTSNLSAFLGMKNSKKCFLFISLNTIFTTKRNGFWSYAIIHQNKCSLYTVLYSPRLEILIKSIKRSCLCWHNTLLICHFDNNFGEYQANEKHYENRSVCLKSGFTLHKFSSLNKLTIVRLSNGAIFTIGFVVKMQPAAPGCVTTDQSKIN